MFREYSLIGFKQFMLLDCAADYTVKQAGGTEGLGSIKFREGDSKWNMMASKSVSSFLYGLQVGGLGTMYCILHTSL